MNSIRCSSELSKLTAAPCVSLCGMCPSCVFSCGAADTAARWGAWRASDHRRRRFLVQLLLRCTSAPILQRLQNALAATSWTMFTYARSTGPPLSRDYPGAEAEPPGPDGDEKPVMLDRNGTLEWFSGSPDWIKSDYLCRLLILCDSELLRMVNNLISVLLVRIRRGFLQFDLTGSLPKRRGQDTSEDSEIPALMVVPGASKSMSGVGLHVDFIVCLPVHLSKRILGLFEDHTLRRCQKVGPRWQQIIKDAMEERKYRKHFQDQINAMVKRYKGIHHVSPTYAKVVQILVPTEEAEREEEEDTDVHSDDQKELPFKAAYGKLNTTILQMEERNVFCGTYFHNVLLTNEDPHLVVDYKGNAYMVTASKNRALHLFHVATEATPVSVLKGHVGSIRAVLLYEERDMVITASCDTSIRCWSLKTDRCEMVLYGHTSTINCLDVHGNILVSGAKDCLVKVWDLKKEASLEGLNFKHLSPVQCVKIDMMKVYSSCDRGLVKVWDIKSVSLLRVIDGHRCSVKFLFYDEWHLLSGDINGRVKAWSTNCLSKECLMIFKHPKEVRSLTLIYLRVVTGCVDGKIRIFNFLTGECLRQITAVDEPGRIVSIHTRENSILVNTTTDVKMFYFIKVFWDYTESAAGGQEEVLCQDAVVSEKSAASLGKRPFTGHMPHAALSRQSQVRGDWEAADQSEMLSEKALCERMRKRGLHHPPSRDSILLRVAAIQRAQCVDEVSINTECNAQLRDSWGPRTPEDPLDSDFQDVKKSLHAHACPPPPPPPPHTHGGLLRRGQACVPISKRGAGPKKTNSGVTSAPHTPRRHRRGCFSGASSQS